VQGRHLVRGGEPAFLLADTAWELPRNATPEQVLRYLDDRADKGFEAVFIVGDSHYAFTPGIVVQNHAGEPYMLDETFDILNPRYFDFLDFVITEANRRGLTVGIVPVWAGKMELHAFPWVTQPYTEAQTLRIARYYGARYAGHDVLWLAGGDNSYDTPERRAFWTAFGETIDEASGGRHLVTIHPGGFKSSYEFFPDAPWIDFHMYQSSHVVDGYYASVGGLNGFKQEPVKPVMNGEANYEDLFASFWDLAGDTTAAGAHRITPLDVRQALYESVLSGGTAGFGYGANGVWQWSTDRAPGPYWPRRLAIPSLAFEGSQQVGQIREILEAYDVHALVPQPERIRSIDGTGRVVVASNETHMLAYVPAGVRAFALDLPTAYAEAHWLHPVTATVLRQASSSSTFVRPGTGDALLVLGRPQAVSTEAGIPAAIRHNVAPNPSAGDARLWLDLEEASTVRLTVFDVLGRRVSGTETVLPAGTHQVQLGTMRPGTYVYALDLAGRRVTGSFVVTDG
ncbi:MAG: DUF4038 domain-containing protein, partial [Bacteroidota bacterium]